MHERVHYLMLEEYLDSNIPPKSLPLTLHQTLTVLLIGKQYAVFPCICLSFNVDRILSRCCCPCSLCSKSTGFCMYYAGQEDRRRSAKQRDGKLEEKTPTKVCLVSCDTHPLTSLTR